MIEKRENAELEWQDLTDIRTDYSGVSETRDTVRKGAKLINEYIDAGWSITSPDNNDTAGTDISERERVKLEKQKIYDLRREVNEAYRATARDEMLRESILEAVGGMPPIAIAKPSLVRDVKRSDRSLVVTLADCHYGRVCDIKGLRGETLNAYSPEIFERRMEQLLEMIVNLLAEVQVSEVVVAGLGDSVDGLLRVSQIFSLRYGMVDSTMRFSEYLAEWLNALSEFTPVRFVSVGGNHDVIRPLGARKASDFPKENLARIISWFVSERLKGNERVKVIGGGNIELIDIQGFDTLMIHGDCDKRSGDVARDYGSLYSVDIDIVFRGHLHSFEDTTCGVNREGHNIYEVQAPSICGIDDYAVSLKKTATAGSVGVLIERGEGKRSVHMLPLG